MNSSLVYLPAFSNCKHLFAEPLGEVVSIFLMPMVALFADVDLRRAWDLFRPLFRSQLGSPQILDFAGSGRDTRWTIMRTTMTCRALLGAIRGRVGNLQKMKTYHEFLCSALSQGWTLTWVLERKTNFAPWFFYVPVLDGARYESHEASPFLGKSGMMPQMPQMPHIPMPQMSRKPGQLPSPAASREMQLGYRGR